MFARFTAAAILALPVFAAASAIPRDAPSNQCNTGAVQCCNSVQQASSPTAELSFITGLLGVVLGSVTGQVGVTCSPITGLGVGGNSCTQQPVCCTNNSFNGVIALGCTPINLSL